MAVKITLQKKLSRAEFRRRYLRVVESLAADHVVLPDGDRSHRLSLARDDHFYFFQTYLPHYFSDPEAPFHHDLIRMLDRRPGGNEVPVPVAVAAPREFAKSTIASFGYVLHQLCFNQRRFVIIGSDTEDLAGDLTSYVLLELCRNERIHRDFGVLGRETWSSHDFVSSNGVRVLARGRGQRIRGLKYRQYRPDLVILDDLENDEAVRNPRLVKALLKWITETVYPGIDARGNLFVIGTILGRRSGLNIIVRGEEEPFSHWRRTVYRALGEDGTSLWPSRHPPEKLAAQKLMMGSVAFNKEKQNSPLDEDGPFREEWFRFYTHEMLSGRKLAVVGFLDPSSRETGDEKGLVTVGLDRETLTYYVLDAWVRRGSPARMIEVAYERHEQYGWLCLGVEDNALKDFLHFAFDETARRRGYHLPIKPIHNATNKEARIVAGLSHLVEQGKLLFLKGQGDQDKVVEQLLYLDQPSVPDDGADALEGAVRLLKDTAGAGDVLSSGRRRRSRSLTNY